NKADFVACHNPAYVTKYPMVEDVKEGGTFLLNCGWSDEELEQHIPGQMKRFIAANNIKFYTIDGIKIGKEIGLGGRINTVLQSAFFKLANIIPADDAIRYMKDAATASYSKKGDAIVKMNHDAIDRGAKDAHQVNVPASWKNASDTDLSVVATGSRKNTVDFVNDIVIPVNSQRGNSLPVSTFTGDRTDGTFPQGTAAFEKRGVAVDVPMWNPDNCIQCSFCSLVCPHAVIRPYAMTEDEAEKAPKAQKSMPMTGMADKKFAIGISVLDCLGCGLCANVCPGKKGEKALTMQPLDSQREQQNGFHYLFDLPEKADVFEKFKETTVKGSQFKQPLLEFSGACAGCGETPYAKLATQLYGDKMYIANATGCSSIWGGSAPATPYTVNKSGFGPAWSNSLFEDNAEYGYGMFLAQDTIRKAVIESVEALYESSDKATTKAVCKEYLDTVDCSTSNAPAAAKLVAMLESCGCDAAKGILSRKDYLTKKSIWILGGDGWAYDIGFGGLDHVIASRQNVNILVFDTEVYSNTGGQSS
ncbi:MAG: 2-oxoacid:acceptor oxidoreductase family protein, partial [Oscillospiraceae bacterium]